MTDEEKKAIERLTNYKEKIKDELYPIIDFEEEKAIGIVLNLIEKQEKVIDEMAKFLLFDIDNDIFDEYFCSRIEDEKCKQIPDGHCEECIKQYFYRKVEKNDKS